MRSKIICVFIAFILVGVGITQAQSNKQKGNTTIILLRHAEKDMAGGNDPNLSPAGKVRAERLAGVLQAFTPDAFYSTPYLRTQQTLEPWAAALHKDIKLYDAKDQPTFADSLKLMKGKTIVVAGHSNTIPPLVNLLINSDKYANLADTEYDKIYIITIKKNGAVIDKVLTF